MTRNSFASIHVKRRHRGYIVLPVACMALIYLLSSIPGTPEAIPERYGALLWIPPNIQNLLHIPLYGGLAWLWCWAGGAWTDRKAYLILTSVTIASLFGVLDEWHQLGVPGRYFSFTDIALNIIGVLLGVEIFRRLPLSHPRQ
jgi:hypothetical protein